MGLLHSCNEAVCLELKKKNFFDMGEKMSDTTCFGDYRWDFLAQAELLLMGRAMAMMLGIIKPWAPLNPNCGNITT